MRSSALTQGSSPVSISRGETAESANARMLRNSSRHLEQASGRLFRACSKLVFRLASENARTCLESSAPDAGIAAVDRRAASKNRPKAFSTWSIVRSASSRKLGGDFHIRFSRHHPACQFDDRGAPVNDRTGAPAFLLVRSSKLGFSVPVPLCFVAKAPILGGFNSPQCLSERACGPLPKDIDQLKRNRVTSRE
jgi:hypothetical protein